MLCPHVDGLERKHKESVTKAKPDVYKSSVRVVQCLYRVAGYTNFNGTFWVAFVVFHAALMRVGRAAFGLSGYDGTTLRGGWHGESMEAGALPRGRSQRHVF